MTPSPDQFNLTLLIAGTSLVAALGGATIGGIFSRSVARFGVQQQRAQESFAAAVDYLRALDALTLQMLVTPRLPSPTRIDRLADRILGDWLGHFLGRLMYRAAYGRQWEQLADNYFGARAKLELSLEAEPARSWLREAHRRVFTLNAQLDESEMESWRVFRANLGNELRLWLRST